MATIRRVRRSLVAAGLALVLGAQALATTYVVDDNGGPGVDFTDLPAAVAAAQPGDVLRVMPGSYSAFTCTKGITILGYGGPTVNGAATLTSIPQGRPLVLAGLSPRDVLIGACDAPVILQQVSAVDTIRIESSVDVRLLDVHTTGFGSNPGQPGIAVDSSRVEIVQSDAVGVYAYDQCSLPGGPGLRVAPSSRVHFALSNSTGGEGPDCNTQGAFAAAGGPGILVDAAELIVAGGGQGRILGGAPGYAAWWFTSCYYDGRGGSGIVGLAADVDYSRVQVDGAGWATSPSINNTECWYFVSPDFEGAAFDFIAPRHSTLALTGTPTAGQAVSLTLSGAPGSHASIWLGRQWILQPEANVDIELAVNRLRVIELGTMPASGSITVPLEVSGAYAPGARLGVQGECRFASGLVRRTNSIPIVVR